MIQTLMKWVINMIVFSLILICLYVTYYCIHFYLHLKKDKNYLGMTSIMILNLSIITLTTSLIVIHY